MNRISRNLIFFLFGFILSLLIVPSFAGGLTTAVKNGVSTTINAADNYFTTYTSKTAAQAAGAVETATSGNFMRQLAHQVEDVATGRTFDAKLVDSIPASTIAKQVAKNAMGGLAKQIIVDMIADEMVDQGKKWMADSKAWVQEVPPDPSACPNGSGCNNGNAYYYRTEGWNTDRLTLGQCVDKGVAGGSKANFNVPGHVAYSWQDGSDWVYMAKSTPEGSWQRQFSCTYAGLMDPIYNPVDLTGLENAVNTAIAGSPDFTLDLVHALGQMGEIQTVGPYITIPEGQPNVQTVGPTTTVKGPETQISNTTDAAGNTKTETVTPVSNYTTNANTYTTNFNYEYNTYENGTKVSTTVTTKAPDTSDLCALHPDISLCKVHTASASNCGSPPPCDGDAIACTALIEQFKRNCQTFEDPEAQPYKDKYDQLLASYNDVKGGAWGDNATSKDVSNLIDFTQYKAGTVCPFTNLNGYFQGFGPIPAMTITGADISVTCDLGTPISTIVLLAVGILCALLFYRSLGS
ncbi:hypothetical protein LIN78_17820 [Leeia sp. TBRC 13508]|uniref:Uncharacterized protein n=1 Tax=Leeia speluncae TaxID=2884804 RepID=A0ABS8DB12_9NEIS|nr:hypothetical protein [Leeia speluncae]MCB6185408.1 hypothetical protein [Leeia speluncae]